MGTSAISQHLARARAELDQADALLLALDTQAPAQPCSTWRRKRRRVPVTVALDVIDKRSRRFITWQELKIIEVTSKGPYKRVRGEPLPTSKVGFAQQMRLNPREFARWFSATNGIRPDSPADKAIGEALDKDTAKMRPSAPMGAENKPISQSDKQT